MTAKKKFHFSGTINFLFRSTKEEAPLTLRLLFRNNNTDYVFGSNIKLQVSKEYWTKQHNNKRIKETAIVNKKVEVNDELGKIQKFILNAFDNADANIVDKNGWKIKSTITIIRKLNQNNFQPT